MQTRFQTMRKKPKPRNPKRNSVDLISDLPDPVIQHILSFLPSEEAAKTCILSKRWLNLWASVPVLDICINRIRRRSYVGGSWSSWKDELVKYMNGFLLHRDRNARIEKFSFWAVYFRSIGPHLENWIDFALENKVKHLTISFVSLYGQPHYTVSNKVFSAESLTYLNLGYCDFQKPLSSVNLPNLKEFVLDNVTFDEDSTFHHIFNNCTSIETLTIRKCLGLREIEISSLSLKSLNIGGAYHFRRLRISSKSLTSFILEDRRFSADVEEFDINAPNLLHFMYQGNPTSIPFKTSSVLLEAKLDFEDWDGYVAIEEAMYDEKLVKRDYKRFNADWFTKLRCFIDHLHYAKVLKINCCDKALLFPKGLADTLPPPTNKFKNLEINLTSSTKQCRRNLVKSLLLLCPSMETLSVNLLWAEHMDARDPNLKLCVNVHDHRQKLGFSPAYIRKQRLECQWPPSCVHQF